MGFFVLVVLIVEVLFGFTAGFSTGNDRTYLIVGMLGLIFLLVLIVAGMAVFRPYSLYGVPAPTTQEVSLSISEQKDTWLTTVERPTVFWGSGIPGFTAGRLQREIQAIKEAFPKSRVVVEDDLTPDRFRDLLTANRFDIVQLTVNVRSDGSVDLFHTYGQDLISADGVVNLLEISETRLLILASCNSVPLATKLASRINMIAATSNLPEIKFAEWSEVFYRLLSEGKPLSRAYSVAESSVKVPLAILMKQDFLFLK